MIRLFFSYSHEDESYRDELEIHLAMLKRQGLVSTWHDRRIDPGSDIHGEISEHLESSDVVLLLVSPYFLASDYCYDVELSRALKRHERAECVVIPVILHPCDWKHAPFKALRATPTDGKPISKFANLHDAFLQVTTDIRKAAEQLGRQYLESTAAGDSEVSGAEPSRPTPEARSGNLRIKKEFSDHDRDRFTEEAFEYIERFFETSLEELKVRNSDIDVRFKRLSAGSFSAAVYVSGNKRASCRMWQGGRSSFEGDIAYSVDDAGTSGSFNESMRVSDDGYTLGLRPLGMAHLGRRVEEQLLTPHGAAEYFWSIFISPLQ